MIMIISMIVAITYNHQPSNVVPLMGHYNHQPSDIQWVSIRQQKNAAVASASGLARSLGWSGRTCNSAAGRQPVAIFRR